MYSSKENVNILTALLVSHGIHHAVVCPGSRNAPIVHNLNECPLIACYPVTDERSAGFYALGIAQATDEPVVVCVTSGSALLNLAPAVAEAHYQHQSLIVVSADRPEEWIDQLDGQTLRQSGALASWATSSVTLPLLSAGSPSSSRWHCNRLVNEVLLDALQDHRPCVHINVPIAEPLFDFTVASLPQERTITRFAPTADYDCLRQDFIDDFLTAQRPMIIVGQMNPNKLSGHTSDYLFSHVIVLHEALSPFPSVSHFDEVLAHLETEQADALLPDFVLYVGDHIVSKRLKHFLRRAVDAHVWRVSPTGSVEDTFQNLRGVITGDADFLLNALNDKLSHHFQKALHYRREWLRLLMQARDHCLTWRPAYSQMLVVSMFEKLIDAHGDVVHYANSMAIRLANIYARHHVWCNRGVNGIEGSLSTAAGYALTTQAPVYCVIGDLSFFYDQNALWNTLIRHRRLRILLLNNGQGGIFGMLSGLEQTDDHRDLVAGRHHTSAEGACRQNAVGYRLAHDLDSLTQGLDWLTTHQADHPLLLEVFTDAETDAEVLRNYYVY